MFFFFYRFFFESFAWLILKWVCLFQNKTVNHGEKKINVFDQQMRLSRVGQNVLFQTPIGALTFTDESSKVDSNASLDL